MRWLATILFLLVFCNFVKSQNTNLVLNSSFEEHIDCPGNNDEGIVYYGDVPYWNDSIYLGTPDYFNSCAVPDPLQPWFNYPLFGVPKSYSGFQYANSGVSYTGIITYIAFEPSKCEYLVSRLKNPLKERRKYIISFYCSLADTVAYSTSKLGALLSTNLPIYNDNLWNYIPQVVNSSSNNPLVDKQAWSLVQDTFDAGGGENYVIIGNFFDIEHSDTSTINFSSDYLSYSYYFIDDVSVIELDTSTGIKESSLMHFQIYPNPAQNSITINNKASVSVSIYSLSGVLLFTQAIKKEEPIDIGQLPNGVYFVAVGNRREKLVVCK